MTQQANKITLSRPTHLLMTLVYAHLCNPCV